MIIDVHSHPDFLGLDMDGLLKNLEENGIDRTWLLPWEAPADEYDPVYNWQFDIDADGPASFKKCLAYVKARPDKFILGYAPDPRRPESIDRLKMAVATYGVKVYGELKLRVMYDNPDVIRMFRYCGEIGIPVLLHNGDGVPTGVTYPRPDYWYGGGIESLERMLALCPETVFIGHAPGFWAHISGDDKYISEAYPKGPVLPGGKVEALLCKYPNLYCDISAHSGYNALNRDHEYTRKLLLTYQDRICYGRDYYDSVHRDLLESLGLPSGVSEKIYSGNAKKILRGDIKI